MWIDYNVQRTARRCAATDRVFAPGEEFYSALVPPEDDPASDLIERRDFSREVWSGPPEHAIGWWLARMPAASDKPRLAPNEVLLELFDRWADDAQRAASRYVLTLLLLRRKVFKVQADGQDGGQDGAEVLMVACPDRDAVYEVVVEVPGEQRAADIQTELFALLYDRPPADPSPSPEPSVDGVSDQAA